MACTIPPEAELDKSVYVIDGDTLVLAGGRKVRLIGIDTPEIGREDEPDEPFALAARGEAEQFLGGRVADIRLVRGHQARDRHGRLLAHVYDRGGRSLGEHLLRAGLAYQITIPPNVRFSDCYQRAELEARTHRRGIWRQPALESSLLAAGNAGFERVEGRVEAVRHKKGATWIDLEGPLALRISDGDLHRFDKSALNSLPGLRIEVRGWIYRSRGRLQMRLRHPSSIRPI